ncbi:MAG: metallophosphoesterase [Promethearchaeota archaeon]
MHLAREIVQGKTTLTPSEIDHLCAKLWDLYSDEPNIVETPDQDAYYIGDLHGDLRSAELVRDRILQKRASSFIFLGDYVDRGPAQIETINLVMALAIENSSRVLMIRGNHESREVSSRYGFRDAVLDQYSKETYDTYCNAFKVLPLAGFTRSGVFACHGGIPEGVNSLEEIQKLNRMYEDFTSPTLWQLVWNDPADDPSRFRPSLRGGNSRYFGAIAFREFTKATGIARFIRAHEVFQSGYKTFFGGKLVSVFSTSYNRGIQPRILRLDSDTKITPIDL